MKKSAKQAPVAPKLSPAEELASELNYLQRKIERMKSAGDSQVEKLKAEMTSSWYATQRLEWIGSYAVTICEGALAEEILAHVEPKSGEALTIDAACGYVVEKERQALICHHYRGSSTSQFHNATMEAKADAASRLVGTFGITSSLERIKALRKEIESTFGSLAT